jgi:hypothetical protein
MVSNVKKTVTTTYIQIYPDTIGPPSGLNQLKNVIENTLWYMTCQLRPWAVRWMARGPKLTAKNVPGKNTIVTTAMDRMCFESRLVANAISTFVSPCPCSS